MMEDETTTKIKPRKKSVKRVLLLVLGLAVLLIVVLFLLAPVFISSQSGRRMILARINSSVTGETDFADLSMGWLKGITIDDFSFNDDAGGISVQVRQIAAKPQYASLLTGGLSLGRTLIDKPNVAINLKEPQQPQAGNREQQPSEDSRTGPIALPVSRMELVLNDGSFKVTDPKAGSVSLSQINSTLNLQPPGQQTDFSLNMIVAQAGKPAKIEVASGVTPSKQDGWSLTGTSGDLTVDVNGLDLESLGPIFALAGVQVDAKGLLSGQVKSKIKDGKMENLAADFKGRNLDITAEQLKGDRLRTSTLEADVKLSQAAETIKIDNLQLKSDWASVTAGGSVPNIRNLAAPALLAAIPRMKPKDLSGETTEQYALCEPGRSYLVYVASGETVELDLTEEKGVFAVRWLNPKNGEVATSDKTVAGGAKVHLTPEFKPCVLWLIRQ